MKIFKPLLSILLLIVFTLPYVFAQESTIIKKVNFAEEANWPPFTPNKYGPTQEGLSYILMKEIFSRLDIEISLDLFPQKRMLIYVKEGRKDAATVISKNNDRLKYLEFSEPILEKKGFVYYLKQKHPSFHWKTYEDLKGLSIGVVAGHNLGQDFTDAIKKYKLDIYKVNRSQESFEKLLTGKFDVVLSIEPTANHFLEEPKYGDNIARASKKYYSKYYHIGFSKNSQAKMLLPKVNRVINQMKKEGSLQKILDNYYLSF